MKLCQNIAARPWISIVAVVLLLPGIIGCASSSSSISSASQSPPSALPPVMVSAASSPSAAPSSSAPEGIDPDKFIDAVNTYISDLNAKNTGLGDLTVKVSVTYIIGFVDITLTDLTSWSSFNDTEKKEFIIALGKALDTLAAKNTYPGTDRAVGSDTTLNSLSGQALAERTSLGIVTLY